MLSARNLRLEVSAGVHVLQSRGLSEMVFRIEYIQFSFSLLTQL